VQASESVTISIPAGIADGQTLRVRGSGDTGRQKSAAGDLFVHIHVRSDPRYEREGDDIRSVLSIPLLTAILGGEESVETVQGPFTLHIAEGTQPGQILRLKGKGMPVLNTSRHGDHYVTIQIEIPKKLSRDERRLVEEWRNLIK
jgi:DnaJ-class molecular chaperone